MNVLVLLVGVVIAVVVLGGVLRYLHNRLIRDPFAPGPQRRVAAAVLGGLFAVIVGCLLAANLLPARPFARLALPGYLGLALLFYLLLALAVLELPRLALRRHQRRRELGATVAGHQHDGAPHDHRDHGDHTHGDHGQGDHTHGDHGDGAEQAGSPIDEVDAGRRRTLARVLAGTAGAVATATVGFGYVRATSRVRAKPVTVRLVRDDPAIEGLRIAVLSDIHITSGLRERSWVADTVATVNAAGVDLVAVVGDLVDGSVAELGDFARPLADLRAPLGTFFVTGNHEYFSGADEWAAFLPTLGLRVLRNERVEIRRGDLVFDLAGVDDVAGERTDGGGPDLPAALADRDPERTVVLLAHQPVLVDEARDAGVDLQISGHTHGGQMWPLHYIVRLQQGHVAGLERVGATVLYTSRGVGSWGPPVRVGAPPEISILTLRAGASR